MSLKRSLRRLGKFVKKAAPIAATIGLGFALGPAGAGFGARVLGGLGRVVKTGAKLAAPVIEAAVRGQEQQASSSPEFDQQDAAMPPQFRQPIYAGRLRPRFANTLGASAAAFPEEDTSMSLLSTVKGVLPGVGQVLRTAAVAKLSKQFGTGGILSPGTFPRPSVATSQRVYQTAQNIAALPNAYAWTGMQGGMMGFRRRSKRINPTNVKALRRALRRVEGFVKLEKRVDKILRHAAPRARQARQSGFVKPRKR